MRLTDADALEEIWKLYKRYQPRLATNVYEFGEALRELIDNALTVEPQKVLVANVTFDKDELEQIVRDRVIEPIKNGELVLQTDKRPQGEWIPIKSLMEDNHHSRISFRCNRCRYVEGYRAKYCAGCGAFMRAKDGG